MSGNGCGPEWLPRFLKRWLFDWFFEASCNYHDEGYDKGGNEPRRWECDFKFFLAMLRDTKRVRWYFMLPAFSMAISYYLIVLLTGWIQFNYPGSAMFKLKAKFALLFLMDAFLWVFNYLIVSWVLSIFTRAQPDLDEHGEQWGGWFGT